MEDIEEAVTLQIQSVAQAVSAMEKISVKAEGQEPDRENEIWGITDETSEGEELANGRLPGEMQYDERRVYDPDDTIYHKTYYDDFTQGLIMGIDYYPKVSMEKELEDYFKEGTESHPLDYLVSMFYDNRTIEKDESELWELFVGHGYNICFHHAEFSEYKLRIVEITDRFWKGRLSNVIVESLEQLYHYMDHSVLGKFMLLVLAGGCRCCWLPDNLTQRQCRRFPASQRRNPVSAVHGK